jgi:hypothetical protein
MAKNREVPIKMYFKWWTSIKLVWAMTGAEDELRSALVTYVGGAWPASMPEQVTNYLLQHHDIPLGDAQIRRYRAGSFLISFRDDQVIEYFMPRHQ